MRLLLAVLLLTTLAGAETPEQLLERTYRPLVEQYRVPGMVVAVTLRGQRHYWSAGPVSRATLFELGSVSKTFTATLIGLSPIRLDQHPGELLPSLRGCPIDRATVLNLATYTAGGLPLQFPDEAADALTYFQHWQPEAPPGTVRRYSNPSIALAGSLAAVALHGDFSALMEQRVFAGLGLRHTFVRVPAAEMASYSWGHDEEGRQIRVNPGLLDAEAYGAKSCAQDMIAFVEANLDPSNLPNGLRQAVQGTQVGYFQVGDTIQGLGWEQYRYPVSLETLVEGNSSRMSGRSNPVQALATPPSGPRLFNKTGSTNGFGAYVVFVPERKLGLVMLANKSFPNADRVRAAYAVLSGLGREDGKAE